MNSVSFHPWVGSHFASANFGKRVLVLGDSHYEWNGSGNIDQWKDITKILVQEQIDGEYTKRFWTNIAVMFLDRLPTLDEKLAFWHSIAFYNYLQSSAGVGPDSIPLIDQWRRSESAFYEVITTLKPQLVAVLGNRLWRHLPDAHREAGPSIPGSESLYTYRYTFSGGGCLAVHVQHPGRAFNGRAWHPHLTNAINVA